MTEPDLDASSFDRSCLLIVSTVIGAFAWLYFVDVILSRLLQWQLLAQWLGLASLLLSPVVVPVIHYRCQSPSRSSAPDAVLTAVVSLGLLCGLEMTLGLWLHRAVGRGM